ncbi:MAG TPA: hypothetical protein VFH47_02445, partial [Candidatus Thermoplasmatota archaeon]|nr:hypothetical protein [Candidatus Thermoplasmatota archaeon]
PNPPPLIPITPLLLSRLTFQVCVGEGNARVLGPEIELPDPWALDLGSLPLGAQELVFRGTSRDGRTEMLLVRLTADEQPPEVLVVVPPVTHFGVPFDIQVLTHDTLAVEVRLEMPGVDLDQVAAGQQPRILRSSTTAPAPLEIPSLADAIRRQLPTVVDGKRVFDNVQEFLYDTNGDGIPEGYYDMQNQVRRPFARRDCTADGVQDLIVDLGPNGAPDGRLCQEGDLVLQVLRCGAAGAVSSLLVDHNRNGRCDKGVVLPSGKTADEYYLGLINPDGTLEPRFLAGGAGDPAIRAFLQAGPTTVFTYSVLRTGGVGDCDGDGVDDVFVDRELDQDKRGACQEGERFVKGEAGMDRRALLEAAIPQLALAGFRIRAQDAAGNAIEFQPQQALTVDPGVSQYQLAPNLHYVGPWPASFVAGIKVVVGDKEWAVVPGAPVGDQVRIDAVNRTLALGRALPAGTKVTVTYPTQVETVLASADLRLVGAAVEGREPRLFRDEGGRMVPDEAPLKAPRSATDPRLVFLPGDVVRFNATVEQQGGINAVPFTVLVNGRPFGQCADPANRTLDPIPPGKQSIVCSLGTFPPGVHTVRVQAVTDPLWVETDPNDQVTEVTFEVYAGVVRYTPAGANAPREFFIRARDNGLVRLEGGAIDLEADRSYDLRLEEEFVIRDGKGRSRTLAVYAFDYEQTRRFQGKQESMTVTLYWDPLERCDIRHIGLCGPDPKDFAKSDNGDCLATEVCRAVTVVPTVKFPVAEDRDSPGAGILVLLLLAGLAAYRRRRS